MYLLLARVDLSGNQQMMIGAGVIAAVFALSNEKVKAALSNSGKGILGSLGKVVGLGGSSSPSSSVSSVSDVHAVVSNLITYFTEKKDDRGVSFSAAVGQHVYEKQIDEAKALMPVNKVAPAPPTS